MFLPPETKYRSLINPMDTAENDQAKVELYKSYKLLYGQFKADKNLSLAAVIVMAIAVIILLAIMIVTH